MTEALAGLAAMMLIAFLRVPIALAMGVVGVVGYAYMRDWSWNGALAMAQTQLYETGRNYTLSVVPLFILMGNFVTRAGMSQELFRTAYAFIGHRRGGLVMATIIGCAGFGAICGSSIATAATFAKVAYPSMKRFGYADYLSTGSIAAGGTLGILIPPSVNMIVYGSLTNNSIGKLFIAGIVPGLLLTGCFMLWIWASNVLGGKVIREPLVPLPERIRTLRYLVAPLVVFGIVMGSLYFGIATATESAALGTVAALFFVWQSGKMNWEVMRTCFVSTARISGMILLIITAAFILNLTISLTGVADQMTKWVAGLGLSATGLLLVLIVFYLVLGMFMDVLSMQVATIPITYPIVTALGVDPIWYGIFIVLMCELGLITPPVGMNLFVVHGIRPDKGGIQDAIWGALPYALIMIVFTLLLMAVPQLATWLPRHM